MNGSPKMPEIVTVFVLDIFEFLVPSRIPASFRILPA